MQMSAWSFEALWQKAKLFAERASEQDREGPLFPFWGVLALELLARAALAKTHPALLADPTDHNNILYAFGLGSVKNPKSIPAKALFSRCSELIPKFTQDDRAKCMIWMDLRNQEVHTGALALEGLPATWLSDYYRICNILLSHIDKTLSDLFGLEEAAAAEKMIGEATKEKAAEVSKMIGNARIFFEVLSAEEKDTARSIAKTKGQSLVRGKLGKMVVCPICEADAALVGEHVRSKDPKIEDDVITQEIAVIPIRLECFSCRLRLEGYESLQVAAKMRGDFAAFAGQFAVEVTYAPEEFYEFSRGEEDYYHDGEEYMNE
jgi:hypothetical protein